VTKDGEIAISQGIMESKEKVQIDNSINSK
jgi:hypothetical protein